MTIRLFHFSDDSTIVKFHPRPVRVAVERPAGQEWLNGPLVWSTDEAHELLYLFPRECPRIVVWPTPSTSIEDRAAWFGGTSFRAIAHIEHAWLDRFKTVRIYRYHLPVEPFEDIGDVGMHVSRTPVVPTRVDALDDLVGELASRGIALRVVDRLTPLKGVWQTTLHASGIRLRNAQDWGKPEGTHSQPGRTVTVT